MKIFQVPIVLLLCYGMVISNLVKIEKTKPQIIFEPLGKLVTQFTYANIKIHLDLKPLQEEVLDAKQAVIEQEKIALVELGKVSAGNQRPADAVGGAGHGTPAHSAGAEVPTGSG